MDKEELVQLVQECGTIQFVRFVIISEPVDYYYIDIEKHLQIQIYSKEMPVLQLNSHKPIMVIINDEPYEKLLFVKNTRK